jgi:hypothetical protein
MLALAEVSQQILLKLRLYLPSAQYVAVLRGEIERGKKGGTMISITDHHSIINNFSLPLVHMLPSALLTTPEPLLPSLSLRKLPNEMEESP